MKTKTNVKAGYIPMPLTGSKKMNWQLKLKGAFPNGPF